MLTGLSGMNIQIAAQPIIWSNDDFHDLGGDTPLETCLAEMREAGYAGTELGHKFPKDAAKLKPILDRFGLQLVSGWHSTYLALEEFSNERSSFRKHLDFLSAMGSKVVIVAECSKRVYADPQKPLDWDQRTDPFTAEQWKRIYSGLEEFANIAEGQGLKLAYHHHMGTVIQNGAQIDRLMSATQKVGLVGDTGHLSFAGENPALMFRKYSSRIHHVHLKNVRSSVVDKAKRLHWSFAQAVREGVFTVPGDGGIHYPPIFDILRDANYQGWFVVEAEQDPKKAKPIEYAMMARAYIRQVTAL